MAPFERWFAGYVVRHPLLASGRTILPGLDLSGMVRAVAEAAWLGAVASGVGITGAAEPVVEAPPIHLVAPPAPAKRARGGAGWTPEQREAQAERMRQRWASGKGAPYQRKKTDEELDVVAARARGDR